MQDFKSLLHRLADSGLEFVIVGGYAAVTCGYAAVTYGSSLVTRDLDICAVLSEENIGRLRKILAEWHPKHRKTPEKLSFLDFPSSGRLQNLYRLTDVGIIDILSTILGVGDFARLKQAAEVFEIDGRVYHVISLDDLIVAKEAMGRDKDLLAVKELRAIAAKRKDRDA